MGRRSNENAANWHAIEADYRAGTYRSVRALARAHEISHTAISKRAEAMGWSTDPTRTKRERVKACMSGLPVGSVAEDVEGKIQSVVDQVVADQQMAAGNARKVLGLINGYLHRSVIPGTPEAIEAHIRMETAKDAGRRVPVEEIPLVLYPRELRVLGTANLQAIQTIREVNGLEEGTGDGGLGMSKEDRDAIVAAAMSDD